MWALTSRLLFVDHRIWWRCYVGLGWIVAAVIVPALDLNETLDGVVVVLCAGSWLALVCGILEPSVGGHPMQWEVHSRVIMKKYKTLGPLNYLLSLSSQ